MISFENMDIVGLEHAIRGMRNPMNSWDKSDSSATYTTDGLGKCCNNYKLGPNDLNLAEKLTKAGTDHRKFMRMITVYMDITAPLYWWKEFDTYKVGTVANSCSTMHKIHAKEFTLDDFSHEQLTCETMDMFSQADGTNFKCANFDLLCMICDCLNKNRELYLETNDKKYWWQIIQLLPSSYNQKRTVMLNYEVLCNIYKSRKNHKLDEWILFCKEIDKLPYNWLITNKEL